MRLIFGLFNREMPLTAGRYLIKIINKILEIIEIKDFNITNWTLPWTIRCQQKQTEVNRDFRASVPNLQF